MTAPDPVRIATRVRSIGEEIALHHFRQLDPAQVKQKTGPNDLVTVADVAVEEALTEWLSATYPGTVVLGEEAVAADPSLMSLLDGDQPVWVIDPIDGTINFATGVPMFATILAYVVRGETQMGWIHDPVQDLTAVAERGGGARLLAKGREFRPACTGNPPALSHMTGCVNVRSHADRAAVASLAAVSDRYATQLILRCSGVEYLAAAQAQIDFAAYGSMYPWDHAAGCLIVEEAGGHAARLDGTRYRPGLPPKQHWPLLVAQSEAGWHMVRNELFGSWLQPRAGAAG
ncbi:inositol monophosphatase family protein [Marinibaculum pumilum]|uniref:Inositol monophosphatase family protein n=1 Tax=Marinibaculum pumilum TaxID=1766165 RepID=A0ABV7KU68_9PROT